jgi:hypothetical protein
VAEDAGPVLDAPTFWIGGTPVETAQASQRNGGRTHRTGLERDINVGAVETFRAMRGAGLTYRQHLGVRRRISEFARAIAGTGKHAAVASHHHRTHRHLTSRRGSLCFREGRKHVALVCVKCHNRI